MTDAMATEPTSHDQGDDSSQATKTHDEHNVGDGSPAELDRSLSNISIVQTLPLYREILFVGTICCAQFMTQGGLGQCLNILHIIGNDFGLTNPGELSWLIAAYSLTAGTLILLAGRIGYVY